MVAPFRAPARPTSWPRCFRAMRRTCSGRGPASGRSRPSAATSRGARTIRGCTSTRFRRAPTMASGSCACFPTSIRRQDRVWRVGEPFEAVARTFLPRIRESAAGFGGRARRAARHQATAQRLRPPDARPARSREGRPGLPARLRAAGRALRARARRGSAFPTRSCTPRFPVSTCWSRRSISRWPRCTTRRGRRSRSSNA